MPVHAEAQPNLGPDVRQEEYCVLLKCVQALQLLQKNAMPHCALRQQQPQSID